MRLPASFQSFLTNVVILILGLANSVLLSRWLGASGRGEIAAVMLWPVMVSYLASLGVISATVYFAARPGSDPGVVLGNALALALVQTLVAVPAAYLVLPLLLPSQRPGVVSASRVYLLLVPLSLVSQYGCAVLQGRVRFGLTNALRLITPVGYLAGTAALHRRGALTVEAIVALHLVLNAWVMVASLAVLGAARVVSGVGFDLRLSREMLGYGLKVHLGGISQGANLRLDQMLIAAWEPPVALGLYVAAVSASGVAQMLSQAYRMVSMPVIAGHASQSDRLSKLEQVFRGYWALSVAIALPLGVGLYWAIPLVFGPGFRGAVWPAEVLVAGAVLLGAKEVLAGGSQALGNPLLESKAELAALVVTVAALLVLLPPLGILGAAVASVLSYGTSLAVVVRGLHRTNAVSPADLFRIDRGTFTATLRQLRGRVI